MSPGSDAGSEASVNQELHQPSRPAAPINGSASTSSSVEQLAPAGKPYIALLRNLHLNIFDEDALNPT
ncbi:succinate dehydrogenase subunit 3 [Trifolium pratense]|uniref:Succinate dehydrogenase subunit 3 n=1 Tax=Trifolium pratense TaxID=57577 RepID=A0A2K3MHF1_TRIPR|nr:succinate dehydrogenase subunit 3 [Trifolium pratense]